jgi:hypothetical protein
MSSSPAGDRSSGTELHGRRSELLATGERFATFRGQNGALRPVGTEVEALVAEVERRPAGFR